MNKRYSVAFAVLALSAALAAPAHAGGKGKVKRSAGLDRNGTGVVYSDKAQHHQGIRRVLSFGNFGRTMKVENTINADGIETTIGRGHIRPRETVTHTTTAIDRGTRSVATHHKRGTILRFMNRRTTTRTDDITQGVNGGDDVAESTTESHRFSLFRNVGSVKEVETNRMEVDQATGQDYMSGSIEKYDGDGRLRAQPEDTGGYRVGDAFRGKLEGFRRIDPQGPQIREVYTMKYGFWRAVVRTATLGIFGSGMGKTVTVDHVQDALGTSVRMTTPKETITRETDIEDGRTVSRGTYRRDGFWSTKLEKDTVTIDDTKGVRTVEKLRPEDETTSETHTETQYANGARSIKKENGSIFKVRASSPRRDGRKNWMRYREGKVLSWQYGSVNGRFAARFDTPWFNLGETVFTLDEATGEVGVMNAVADAEEAYDAP